VPEGGLAGGIACGFGMDSLVGDAMTRKATRRRNKPMTATAAMSVIQVGGAWLFPSKLSIQRGA